MQGGPGIISEDRNRLGSSPKNAPLGGPRVSSEERARLGPQLEDAPQGGPQVISEERANATANSWMPRKANSQVRRRSWNLLKRIAHAGNVVFEEEGLVQA